MDSVQIFLVVSTVTAILAAGLVFNGRKQCKLLKESSYRNTYADKKIDALEQQIGNINGRVASLESKVRELQRKGENGEA